MATRLGWKPIPSEARVTRDEVSGYMKTQKKLSGRQYLIDLFLFGTVFQTAVNHFFIHPETTSRVTLASLGIVFQTKQCQRDFSFFPFHPFLFPFPSTKERNFRFFILHSTFFIYITPAYILIKSSPKTKMVSVPSNPRDL